MDYGLWMDVVWIMYALCVNSVRVTHGVCMGHVWIMYELRMDHVFGLCISYV